MFKYLFFVFLFLTITSCSRQFCEKDIYNGWLNGILCNYDKHLIKKEKTLKKIVDKSDTLKKEEILLQEIKLEKNREERILLSELSDLNTSNREVDEKLKRMKHFKKMKKLLDEVQKNVENEL